MSKAKADTAQKKPTAPKAAVKKTVATPTATAKLTRVQAAKKAFTKADQAYDKAQAIYSKAKAELDAAVAAL